jgi:23S rRNA pseudouridine1911/1915/1917 synthase
MTERYIFSADAGGVRLDKFVGEKCPGLSRTHAQKLIAEGHVTVNGRAARPSLKLNTGDKIEVMISSLISSTRMKTYW